MTVIIFNALTLFFAAMMVDAGVLEDPNTPRLNGGAELKAVEVLVGFNKGVLSDVAGVLCVADIARRDVEAEALISDDELIKSALMTREAPANRDVVEALVFVGGARVRGGGG